MTRARNNRGVIVAMLLAAVVGVGGIVVLQRRTTYPVTPPARQPLPSTLRDVDGGARYYARFPRSLPSDPGYFPIGVWFESVLTGADVDADRKAGLNLYVRLTPNSDLDLIARHGMKVIAQLEDWRGRTNGPGGQAIAGWLLGDEVDMQLPPVQGFREMRRGAAEAPPHDGRLLYSNYGKGVTFWNADADASRFVSKFQDVVSADNYWFTDENICGSSEGGRLLGNGTNRLSQANCHRAANYGRTVDRVRGLMRPAGSRPVWAFVEVGHPFAEDHWPRIRPAEVSAAVWSSIIHGARGIVYFNHSFGGQYQTQHALREPAYASIRRAVARTDARIHRLAPVLNAPFVEHFASTRSRVDVMAKSYRGEIYLFAASRRRGPQRTSIRLPCAGERRAEVLDEERTLPVTGGVLVDRFADANSVHIYRISESGCRVTTR